jgi:uncharacterized membrane protein YcjF (UPF0283 family)
MGRYKGQWRLSQSKEHSDEERLKIRFGKWNPEKSAKAETLLSIISSVLGVIGSLIGALSVKLFTTGATPKKFQVDLWIPIAIGLAAAVVVISFIFLLKREPSRVLHLRKKLTNIYLSQLTESIRKSNGAIKA